VVQKYCRKVQPYGEGVTTSQTDTDGFATTLGSHNLVTFA